MAQPETKKNQKYKNKRRATRERRGRDAEATLEKEKGQVEKGVLEEALPADQAPKGTGQPERPTALDPQAEISPRGAVRLRMVWRRWPWPRRTRVSCP